jgi:8-amino-7-oxononanoate synthase
VVAGLDFLEAELAALDAAGRRRSLRSREGVQGPRVRLSGRVVTNFSSNDYLGLAGAGDLVEAAHCAARQGGAGAGASRLIAGTQRVHEVLEGALAAWQKAEAALVFNSGYQANLGSITALAGRGDVIVSDELNHASLIDGCRLSRAEVLVYRHGDAGHAEELLRVRGRSARRRFIVSDSLFSMDGDAAPLAELREVADRHGAALMVDEAHAVGVFGVDGRGLAALGDVAVDVHVGTFGKAFGSFGAYVAGCEPLRDLLINKARSFVFTTALPASVMGASAAALAIIRSSRGEELRRALWHHIRRVKEGLAELGLLVPGAGGSPIFPLLVGPERGAVECCEALLRDDMHVQAIRPPTVPRGTSRLRMTLMATHAEEDIERALVALRRLRDRGLLPTV